jgi:hypothetical protein
MLRGHIVRLVTQQQAPSLSKDRAQQQRQPDAASHGQHQRTSQEKRRKRRRVGETASVSVVVSRAQPHVSEGTLLAVSVGSARLGAAEVTAWSQSRRAAVPAQHAVCVMHGGREAAPEVSNQAAT